MNNILLVVIDCLRYDRVTPQYMPFLTEFGSQNTKFVNFWSVSHCTDPVMTAMLTGRWPDELRLWSMMWGTDWQLPANVEMLAETARTQGYNTGMISNIGRWYTRGVDNYADCRGWPGNRIFDHAIATIKSLGSPWFMTVHDDSCHTDYRGGNYDVACREVDGDLARLVASVDRENTFIIITADHGEGLGERGIRQHGFGLWPFLTHLPLIVSGPDVYFEREHQSVTQHVHVYQWIRKWLGAEWRNGTVVSEPGYAHMVGRTRKWWHRGITDGKTLMVKQQGAIDKSLEFTMLDLATGQESSFHMIDDDHELWNHARRHAAEFGLNADDDTLLPDDPVEQRLRSLGYFE